MPTIKVVGFLLSISHNVKKFMYRQIALIFRFFKYIFYFKIELV